jgi:hypothetical protein
MAGRGRGEGGRRECDGFICWAERIGTRWRGGSIVYTAWGDCKYIVVLDSGGSKEGKY